MEVACIAYDELTHFLGEKYLLFFLEKLGIKDFTYVKFPGFILLLVKQHMSFCFFQIN